MTWLLLALVSFSGVASAQMLDDGTNYPLEKGKASDPLYGNRPARTLSQREYSQLFQESGCSTCSRSWVWGYRLESPNR